MKHNFGAGPGILPQEVLLQASQGVMNLNNAGLSVLEISHRSADFEAILAEAVALVKELLEVPEGYEVLFLQGGASQEFAMAPYNLLPQTGKAAYLDSGVWSSKAIKEAKFYGKVEVVASSKDKNYTYIPSGYDIPQDAAYFHVTSNNTIYGTQLKQFPKSAVPMVSDMSSDIFSRKLDVSRFDLIYAGAQKNMGPAGVTLVIVNPAILGRSGRDIPAIFDYRQHIAAGSMYNTPPVFAVYTSMLTLRWLKKKGGLGEIEKENAAKAAALYAEIDRSAMFKGTCATEDRSVMNACFVAESAELETEFLSFIKERGLVGLKGHRSVGGFRASLYNALPMSSVHVLVEAMQEFEAQHIHA